VAVLVAQLAGVGQHLALSAVPAPHADVLARRRPLADDGACGTGVEAGAAVGGAVAPHVAALDVAGVAHPLGQPEHVGQHQVADVLEALTLAARSPAAHLGTAPRADLREERAAPGGGTGSGTGGGASGGHRRTAGARRLGGATHQGAQKGDACVAKYLDSLKISLSSLERLTQNESQLIAAHSA